MNRRSLLTALPAAVASCAVPAAALCIVDPAETPVMRLYREWQVVHAAAEAAHGDEYDRLHDIRWDMEQRIMAIPAQNERDVLLKLAAWTNGGIADMEWEHPALVLFWAEARALVGRPA